MVSVDSEEQMMNCISPRKDTKSTKFGVLIIQTLRVLRAFVVSNVLHEFRACLTSSNSSKLRGQSSLSKRDSERSASNLPPVWQRAQ